MAAVIRDYIAKLGTFARIALREAQVFSPMNEGGTSSEKTTADVHNRLTKISTKTKDLDRYTAMLTKAGRESSEATYCFGQISDGLSAIEEDVIELRESFVRFQPQDISGEASNDGFPCIAQLLIFVSNYGAAKREILNFLSGAKKYSMESLIDKISLTQQDKTIYPRTNLGLRPEISKEEGSLSYIGSDTPVHPGKLIERYVIDHEWRVPYAAERLGVTREHIYAIMRGRVDISTSMARALERNKIGGTALEWLILQAKYDLAQPEKPPTPKRRVGRAPTP